MILEIVMVEDFKLLGALSVGMVLICAPFGLVVFGIIYFVFPKEEDQSEQTRTHRNH